MNYGQFVGTVVAEWLDDGRLMKLVKPFAYLDPQGIRWDAPEGSVVDGASIPRVAWSLIGGPFEGKYRDASVIHDVACVEQRRNWWDVHLAFYNGMLASEVELVQAKIMYGAVYHFGPRWQIHLFPDFAGVVGRTNAYRSETGDATRTLGLPQSPPSARPPYVPPPMSEDDFQKFATQVRTREQSGHAMSLREIQGFFGDSALE